MGLSNIFWGCEKTIFYIIFVNQVVVLVNNIVSKAINKDECENLSYEKKIEKFLLESSLFSDNYFIIFMQIANNLY